MVFEKRVTVVIVSGLLVLSGCSSSDGEPTSGAASQTESMQPSNDMQPEESTSAPAETPETGGEAAEPTGTIVIDGTTYEVEGRSVGLVDGELMTLDGDFGICEATNPAFPGDANIVVKVGDLGDFGFSIADDVASADLGEPGLQEDATSVSYERTDNTIVGTADFATWGTVEFDITCK